MELSKAKKVSGRYCCAYACRNEPVKRKGGLCHKHYRRKRRKLDPVYCRYNGFKGKAKKRGIGFYVTLEQFRRFCQRTGYIVTKGKRGQNATIDRLCNAHGYHIWNMGLKTNRANASKGNRFSGNCFTRDHHFPEPIPLDQYETAGDDLPF